MIGIFSYVKLSSLKKALLERRGGDGPAKAIYMLPSKSSEDLLLDMLRGTDDYFASKPEVWGWQELYNALVPKQGRRRCVDPPDHYLILRYVRNRTMEEMASSGASIPPGMARRSFVRTLGEAVNEMLLEDVDPELIHDSGNDLLFRLYASYLSYLADHGLADNSQLPSLARRSLAGRLPKTLEERPMRWIGFMSLTGAQLALVRGLAELGAKMEFFMPDSGIDFRDAASQLGAEASSLETGECTTIPSVAPDMYSQCEYIADEIMGTGGGDCGIMAPPERMLALATALNRRGIPWQPRSEVTVDETALMDVARGAWETHKLGWTPARVANLLRGAAFGVEPDASKLASLMPEGADMWKEFFSGDDEGARAISRIEAFCDLLEREDSTCEDLLRGLYSLSGEGEWESRLAAIADGDFEMDSQVREISSSRLEIAQKLAMMGDITPSLGEASAVRFAGDDAMAWLREWAREAAIALPPRQKGVVAVYSSPPPILASHDFWAISDADATRYPGAPVGHALLDEGTREFVNDSPFDFAHLPTIHEKRRQKEALFRRLLAVGERVTVATRAASDPSGNPIGESAFLRPEAFSAPRWRLGKHIEATKGETDRLRIYRKPSRTITCPSGGKTRVSMSSADNILDCPFAYWCEKTARLAPVPEPGQIMDRLALGNVMHEAWRKITASAGREAGHGVALMSEWDSIISSLSGKYPMLSDARAHPALSDLKNDMVAVADIMDDMMARAKEAGMRRVWTKTEFALPDVELENVIFSGRADRVDFWAWQGGEGAVIFDYKLGGAKNHAKGHQLASYGFALRKSGVPIAGFCYLSHGDAQKTGSWSPETRGVFAKGTRGQSAGERIDEAFERLMDIDRLVSLGKYEAKYDSQSCKYCDYTTICRRGERYGDYEGAPDDGG
jgi:hypothetical protein